MMNIVEFENKICGYIEIGNAGFVVGFDGGEMIANYYTLRLDGESVDLWYKDGNIKWHVGSIKFNSVKYVYPLVSDEIKKELEMWNFD